MRPILKSNNLICLLTLETKCIMFMRSSLQMQLLGMCFINFFSNDRQGNNFAGLGHAVFRWMREKKLNLAQLFKCF